MKRKNCFKALTYNLLAIIILLSGCAAGTSEKTSEGESSAQIDSNDSTAAEFITEKTIFYSLPSPTETALIIMRAGGEYNEKLLNPAENHSKYINMRSRALNLGVYLADLSYATLFDRAQTGLEYFSASKKLAEQLGIPNVINEEIINSIKKNQDDKRKIIGIVGETFMNSNINLNPETSTLLIIGCWIEGLYLSTQLVGKNYTEKAELAARIIDQGLTVNAIKSLIDKHKDNPDVEAMQLTIENISSIFEDLNSSLIIEESTDNIHYKFDNEKFRCLSQEIEKVRTAIIN